MRAACPNLTVTSLPAGHWLPLECKAAHIEAIRAWLRAQSVWHLDNPLDGGST